MFGFFESDTDEDELSERSQIPFHPVSVMSEHTSMLHITNTGKTEMSIHSSIHASIHYHHIFAGFEAHIHSYGQFRINPVMSLFLGVYGREHANSVRKDCPVIELATH